MGDSGQPVVRIEGERVALGPMARNQIPTYQRWLSNFDTLRSQGEPRQLPETQESLARWYENHVSGRDDVAWFTVYDRSTCEPIGWTELKDIDHHQGTAEFAIMIGDPEARGRGYGTEVTRLMVEYDFERIGLHNIHLYYMEFNAGARSG